MINASRLRLVIGLMAAAAVIIIGMAVYLFTHFSSMDSTQGIILAIIAIAALFIVTGVMAVLFKSLTASNKTASKK